MNMQNTNKRGFTLLELLIVISIIAILSVILIVALNPAETLKKARDTQRISDMASLKTAIGIYATTISSPDLDGTTTPAAGAPANFCLGYQSGTNGVGTNTTANTAAQISYSSGAAATCATTVVVGTDVSGNSGASTFSTADNCYNTTANTSVDGTGWVPVKLSTITGGSPISNLPIDPTNTITTAATPVQADLVYRYACQNTADVTGNPSTVFEVDARLESATYGPSGTDDRSTKDGGDNTGLYEVGTSVKLLGAGVNF